MIRTPQRAAFRVMLLAGVFAIPLAAGSRLGPVAAYAQSDARPPISVRSESDARREARAINERFVEAFFARDYAKAEGLVRRIIELTPDEYIAWYNLACVLTMRGRMDDAEEAFQQAVVRGFVDFHPLVRDPAMRPLRERDGVARVLDAWREVQDATIDARLERAQNGFGKTYVAQRDEPRRLAFLSGYPASSLRGVREEIDRLTAWWEQSVLPEGESAMSADPRRPDPWVLVVLPTVRDFNRWAAQTMGAKAGSVGGVYDHDRKELITQNLGSSLRHEYLHVLHWRDMARRGRVQPTWIQEGLCSLVEDIRIETDPDGRERLVPISSWRTNQVLGMARVGNLPAWEKFFAKDADRFVSSNPLANYAVARSIFLFMHERGVLRAWYTAYVAGFDADPTGKAAIESAFGMSAAEVEKQWRAWIRTLERVPDQNDAAKVELPLSIRPAGDGLEVSDVTTGEANLAGVRIRDVVLSVAGRRVHDLNDLARVLAPMAAGDRVEVVIRRGGNEPRTFTLTLRAP
ncbi:MAG: tetratricopeptide repeat protein [Phycisphaerales bacterium]